MFSWSPSSDLNEPAPMVEDADGDDMATEDQNIITPYTVTVASGYQLLRDPHHNKGLAFTENEREAHFLRGLLPPAVLSQELQVKEMVKIICSHRAPWQMYKGMMELKERNERLFYKLLITNLEELIPVFDTPSIGKACQTFRSISRQPHGLFISLKEKGRIREVLRNWPEKKIQIIVVTDGEQISSIGDLGCQGMGVAVGKVLLYSALGGVRPSACLPVIIDVGTNNKKLRRDQFYFGLKRKRVTGQRYTELLDEFMTAVKQNYGETVLIQFQGFAHDNALRLLAKYGATHLVFNDDIQLKPSVVLAAIIATLKCIQRTSTDHRILFSGSGEAATDIAQLIALKISKQMDIPMEVARENIFLMDSKGLIAKSRVPSLEPSMRMWANGFKPVQTLLNAVKVIKPRYLIGSSGEGKAFTKEVIEAMSRFEKAHIPFIFTLSNITAQSECTAEEAYNWSLGQVYFASGSPFAPVKYDDFIYKPSQINNAYIFPGFGLGLIISGATRFHEDMLLAASEALSEQVSESNLNEGLVYPPFSDMRKISPYIAARVAAKAYELGLATRLPQPENLVGVAERSMYSPDYCNYR